jgi:hypothetical protein
MGGNVTVNIPLSERGLVGSNPTCPVNFLFVVADILGNSSRRRLMTTLHEHVKTESKFKDWTDQRKGDYALAKIFLECVERDFKFILAPEGLKYDCMIDAHGKILRIQSKFSGSCTDSVVKLKLVASGLTRKGNTNTKYTSAQIDALLCYAACEDRLCWIGPEIFEHKTRLSVQRLPGKLTKSQRSLDDLVWK